MLAFFGCRQRLFRHPGGFGRVARYLLHRLRQVHDCGRSFFDAGSLAACRLLQRIGYLARLIGGLIHLLRSMVDPAYQRTQFLDRIVDRVGHRAGDILGHAGVDREVALGQFAQFVHQAQNRLLVAAVFLFAPARPRFGLVDVDQPQHHQRTDRQQAEQGRQQITGAPHGLVVLRQLVGIFKQRIAAGEQVFGRYLGLHERLRIGEHRAHDLDHVAHVAAKIFQGRQVAFVAAGDAGHQCLYGIPE